MNKTFLMAVLFPALILIQVLICNHIMLFNVAVPFLFIYFIVRYPIGASRNLEFTLSFLLGFLVDLFSDTPGLNALSCTLLSGLRPTIFYAYVPRDDKTKYITPCISTIGWQNYLKYVITLSLIFCLVEFGIEFFSFASMKEVVLMSAASSVLTFAVIIGLDSLLPSGRSATA